MTITLSELRTLVPRHLLLFLLLGFAVRLLVISFHPRPLISDEKEYDQLAYTLASTGSYKMEGNPTAYRPVGYPAFVASVYFFAGRSPIVVKILQALLDCLTALLIFLLPARQNRRGAVWASIFWLFYPPAILYSNFLLSESLAAFLLTLLSFLLLKLNSDEKIVSIGFGLILGFLVLVKPFVLLFFLLLPLIFWKAKYPFAVDKWITLGLLIAVGPWVARNAVVMGNPTLTTNSGINLLIGNNPNATGAYTANLPEDSIDPSVDEVQADLFASRTALDFIRERPGRFFLNGVKKLAHLFSSQGGLIVWSFSDQPEDASIRYAAKYKAVPLYLTLLINVPFAALLILGTYGLFLMDRSIVLWSMLTLGVIWIAVHFVVFGGSRFLFPLFPLLALSCGGALTDFSASFHRVPGLGKIAVLLIILGFMSVWATELVIVLSA